MKRAAMIFGLVSMLTSQMASGQTLTFQGVLRDPVGRTVEDEVHAFTVRLYDTQTGGEALWSETHPDVPIHYGVFSIELGSVKELANVPFDRQYWLGVAIEDADEMYPRFQLSTAASSLSVRGKDNVFPYTGNVGIGVSNPTTKLYITGDGGNYLSVNTAGTSPSGYALDGQATREWEVNLNPADKTLNIRQDGTSDAVTIAPGGKVGIGTAEPAEKLHIAGESGVVGLTVDGNIRVRNGLWISDSRFVGSDGAGNVGLKAGPNWGLTVGSGGHVGIGTSAPDTTLVVNGDVKLSSGGSVIFNDGTVLSTTEVGGSSNYLTNAGDAVVRADDDRNGTGAIQFLTGNETKMALTNGGLLGIGTSSPQRKLDINGDISFTGGLLRNGSPFVATPWKTSGSATYFNTGNVGIGAVKPGYALNINGTVNAKDILNNGSSFRDPWRYNRRDWSGPITDVWSTNSVLISWNRMSSADLRSAFQTGYKLTVFGDMVVEYSPGKQLIVSGNWTALHPNLDNLGQVGYETLPVTYFYSYYIRSNFGPQYFSDRRVKKNIRPLTNSLDNVLKLNGVRYDINTDTHPMFKGRQIESHERTKDILGFIAQDLKEVIPEMVVFDEEYGMYMTRNPNQLLAVLVEALKELKAKNDSLKDRVAAARVELMRTGKP